MKIAPSFFTNLSMWWSVSSGSGVCCNTRWQKTISKLFSLKGKSMIEAWTSCNFLCPFKLFLAISSPAISTAITVAPQLSRISVSGPAPHPHSRTVFPFQKEGGQPEEFQSPPDSDEPRIEQFDYLLLHHHVNKTQDYFWNSLTVSRSFIEQTRCHGVAQY